MEKKNLKLLIFFAMNGITNKKRFKKIETMNKPHLSKYMLVADIIICTIMFFLILHDNVQSGVPSLFILSFPLLRIWLGFILYRRSNLASVPIVLLGLMTVFAVSATHSYREIAFSLFTMPWVTLLMKVSALFDVRFIEACDFQDLLCELYDNSLIFIIIGCIWLVGIPLAVYVYRIYRKQLRPSRIGIWKSIGLHAYILAAILCAAIVMKISSIGTGALSFPVMTLLAPAIFYRGRYNSLLRRHEVAVLLVFAMFAVCYVCSLGLEEKTVICTCMFPAAFYFLVNWYMHRKVVANEYVMIIVASVIFWFAQYTTGMIRIALLIFSFALTMIPMVRFADTTGKKLAGAGLYAMITLVIPVMTIGYNPFSVLEARRVGHFDGYSWAKNGLLAVKGENGYGLRDRYQMILPAEYQYIEIMLPSKPYCMVTKEGKHRIYDIERHELVSEEWFNGIVPCGNNIYCLKSDKGEKYLVLPMYYSHYSEEQPATISNELPVKEK